MFECRSERACPLAHLAPVWILAEIVGKCKKVGISGGEYFASTPDGVTTVDCIGSLLRLSLKYPGLAREILGQAGERCERT
jgi:hypothetical protein